MTLLYSEILYKIYTTSADIFTFLIYLLAFYAIFNFKVFKDQYKWLLIMIIGWAIFELSNYIVIFLGFNDTRFVNHPYSIFSLIILSIWYSKIINTKTTNLIIFSTCVLFILIDTYQVVTSKWPIEGPYILPLSNILFIYLSILVHKKLSQSPNIKNLKYEPLFWFNISFLIVNLFQLVMKPLFDAVIPISDDLAFIVGTIKNLYNPLFYLLFAIGINKLSTQPFRPIASL